MNKLNYKYETLTPFKICVLENFPFIEADFDALTNYQIMCKIVEYLNQTRNNQNIVQENIIALNNWFNNLDVQDEINEKLDQMVQSGELQNLLTNQYNTLQTQVNNEIENINNKVDNEIDSFKTLVNNEIETINNKVNSSVDSTPIVVSSIEEMIETNKIYVNTSNGKWYYYNGSQWTEGGNYQSSGIAENSIDIINLDNSFNHIFNKEYENINLPNNYVGYYYVSNDQLTLQQDNSYSNSIIDLINGEVYDYTGYNYYSERGIIIVDSEDNNKIVSYVSGGSGNAKTKINLQFKANKNGLKAYISVKNNTSSSYVESESTSTLFSKVKYIKINNYYLKEPTKLKDLLGTFASRQSNINQTVILETGSENTTAHIYRISKNSIYKITGYNYSEVAGCVILNKNFSVLYKSSNTNYSTETYYEHNFTASDDGYVILSDYVGTTRNAKSNIVCISNQIYDNEKWFCIGDSLTDAKTLGNGVKNYVNYVSEKLNLNGINLGVSGSGYCVTNSNFYTQANQITSDAKLVTIFGSFNDLYPIMEIGSHSDTGTNTICGCINTTIDNIISNAPDAVIGVILPTPWDVFYGDNNLSDNSHNNPVTYINAIKKICNERSIPVLDLYYKSNLRPWDETFRTTYYRSSDDGVHPNTLGHQRISSQVSEFIKSILY